MTLTAMLTLHSRLLGYDLDNAAANASGVTSAADATDQINYGIRFVSRYIRQFSPKIAFTVVAGTPNYDTDSLTAFAYRMLEIKRVIINGSNLWAASGRRYGLWTVQEVERISPSWITDSGGTPTKAFQTSDQLWLHPTPTAGTLSSGNNYVGGVYLAHDMDSVADLSNEPGVPKVLHEAVVRMAADFAADPNVTEQEGLARLQRYTSKAGVDIEDIRRKNIRMAQSWGSTSGAEGSNFIRM